MCAGLRDSVALAWCLDLVLSGRAEDAVLDSYGLERKGHVCHYIDFSMRLGKIICIADADAEAAAERDRQMIADLENFDGTYTRWLDEIGANYVILRPDFYVAATAEDPEGLRSCMQSILDGLHLRDYDFAVAGAR